MYVLIKTRIKTPTLLKFSFFKLFVLPIDCWLLTEKNYFSDVNLLINFLRGPIYYFLLYYFFIIFCSHSAFYMYTTCGTLRSENNQYNMLRFLILCSVWYRFTLIPIAVWIMQPASSLFALLLQFLWIPVCNCKSLINMGAIFNSCIRNSTIFPHLSYWKSITRIFKVTTYLFSLSSFCKSYLTIFSNNY